MYINYFYGKVNQKRLPMPNSLSAPYSASVSGDNFLADI